MYFQGYSLKFETCLCKVKRLSDNASSSNQHIRKSCNSPFKLTELKDLCVKNSKRLVEDDCM